MSVLLAQQGSTEDLISGALETIQPILEYLGTIAFAITGALVAGRNRMDISGVLVLGAIVSVGGGTLRDLLLQRTVFWVEDPTFLAVGVASAALSIPLFRVASTQVKQAYWLVQSFDAFGLALFVVTGTNIALVAGANDVAATAIGVISGIGGGMIRDILANDIPSVLTDGRLYMVAALAGAFSYIMLLQLDIPAVYVLWVPIVIILGLRYASLRYNVGMPTFVIDEAADPREHDGDLPPSA
jgi:uncharacterized membrane protein YeiH